MTTSPIASCCASLALICFLTGTHGFAQGEHAQSQTSASSEVVTLSAFEVSADSDRGYIATRSYGVTKTNTSLIELPHSAQVFTEKLIADLMPFSIAEVARFASNTINKNNREDEFFIRGFTSSEFREGMQYTGPTTPKEPAAMERVEVIKGASAVLYGSTGSGGVINYIYKKPSLSKSGSLEVIGGEHGLFKSIVDTTGPAYRGENVSAAYRFTGVYMDTDTPRDMEYHRRLFLSAGLSFYIGNSTTLRLRAEHVQDVKREGRGFPWATDSGVLINLPFSFFRGEPSDKVDTDADTFEITAEHLISKDWSLRVVGYLTDWSADLSAHVLLAIPTPNSVAKQFVLDPTAGQQAAVEASMVGNFRTGPANHTLLFGLTTTGGKSSRDRLRWRTTPTFNLLEPVYGVIQPTVRVGATDIVFRRRMDEWGVYLQDQIKFIDDRLVMVGGVRYDFLGRTDTDASAVSIGGNEVLTRQNDQAYSPRAAVLYRISEGLSVYYSFNQAFARAPLGVDANTGNPFENQTTDQNELGIKLDLFDGRIFANLAAYKLVLGNRVVIDPVTSLQFQRGETTSEGVEFDYGLTPAPGWQVIGGLGYQKNRITQDTDPALINRESPGIPHFTLALYSSYTFMRGPLENLTIGVGVRHQSESFADDTNGQIVDGRVFKLPAFTVWNANINYRWNGYTASLSAENLTDKDYLMQGGGNRFVVPGNARWIKASIRYSW